MVKAKNKVEIIEEQKVPCQQKSESKVKNVSSNHLFLLITCSALNALGSKEWKSPQ